MLAALRTYSPLFAEDDILRPDGYQRNNRALLLGTFAISLLSLALPIMTLQVYDRILPNPGTGTLPVLIIGVCVAIALEAMLRLCRSYIIGYAGAAYEHRMACETMQKVLNADLSKMGKYGIGEHLHRMGAVGKLKEFYNGHALCVLVELAFVPLFLLLIFYIAKPLVLVPIVILSGFACASLWRGRLMREALHQRERADNRRFNFLIEALEGVHTLKAFALEKFFQRRYETLEENSTFANYRVTQETSGTFNIGAVFSHLMVASVITAGAWCVLNGFVTTGGLIATLLLSGRIMQPLQKTLMLWARYQDYLLARAHMEELLFTPQQIFGRGENLPLHHASDGKLELREVCYQYKNDEIPLLTDINFEMKRGEAILISGGHGAGKSTLLHLISGIYPASKGEILLDRHPIHFYKPEELVSHVGYIRSNPLIFRGSIRDNITGFGMIAEDQAREVAGLLQVDREVAKLPGGFDTFLQGNSTDQITPGLKQRISMVRVLAAKPRLILFDNADRTLDKDGYAMIYSFLARLKGKASLIIVSDDRNICGLAQRAFVLKDGALKETESLYSQGNIQPYKELRL